MSKVSREYAALQKNAALPHGLQYGWVNRKATRREIS